MLIENEGKKYTPPILGFGYHVFVSLLDVRPSDAQPLVLLTRGDILSELQALASRLQNAEAAERIITEDILSHPQ